MSLAIVVIFGDLAFIDMFVSKKKKAKRPQKIDFQR